MDIETEGTPIDVERFDEISNKISINGEEGENARNSMNQIRERHDSWIVANQIIQATQNEYSKYYALTLFKEGVSTKWNLLSAEEHSQLKNCYFNLLQQWPQQGVSFHNMQKLNEAVIEILKNEWPMYWPTFTHDLIGASKGSDLVCENNLRLLSMLSEEIHDFSDQNLTSERQNELRAALENEINLIYSHIEEVLSITQNPTIRAAALNALAHFLKWMNLKLVMNDAFCTQLVTELLPDPQYQKDVLLCFAAIASHDSATANFEMINIFNLLIHSLIPLLHDPEYFEEILNNPSFLDTIVDTLCSFILMDNCSLLQGSLTEEAAICLQWMLQLTELVKDDTFSKCVDMWHVLARLFKFDYHKLPPPPELISPLEFRLCDKMVRPPEFHLMEIQEELFLDQNYETIESEMYKTMQETLIFLGNIQHDQLIEYLLSKIEQETFQLEMLPFVYSIGAISGILTKENEKMFLIRVIKAFMTYMNQELPEKLQAFAAASFVFMVSKYPRFLSENQTYLEFAFDKLLEFTMVPVRELQSMALNALCYIAKLCAKALLMTKPHGSMTYLHFWFNQLDNILPHLHYDLVPILFQGITELIKRETNPTHKQQMIENLFSLPIQNLSQSIENLTSQNAGDDEFALSIIVPINTLTKIIKISDERFQEFIETIVNKDIELLNFYSNEIYNRQDGYELLIRVKTHLLLLINAFFTIYPRSELVRQIIPVLLNDFTKSQPHLQLSQTLDCFNSLIKKLGIDTEDFIYDLVTQVINPSYEKIREDFQVYPEIRYSFFSLLSSLMTKVYSSIQYFDANTFESLLNFMLWGIEHPQHSISNIALNCISELINGLNGNPDENFKSIFYGSFFIPIVNQLLQILTDYAHKFAYRLLIQILFHLLNLVTNGQVQIQGSEDTYQYVAQCIGEKIMQIQPDLNSDDVMNFAHTILNETKNYGEFQKNLFDFLISLRKASPADQNYLYNDKDDNGDSKIFGFNGPAEPEDFDQDLENDISEF